MCSDEAHAGGTQAVVCSCIHKKCATVLHLVYINEWSFFCLDVIKHHSLQWMLFISIKVKVRSKSKKFAASSFDQNKQSILKVKSGQFES